MTVPLRVRRQRRPLRVRPADRDGWEQVGRAVFLNRNAYLAAQGRQPRVTPMETRDALTVLLMQVLVACGALYAIREVTRVMCPTALAAHDWVVSRVYRAGVRLLDVLKRALITVPVRRVGCAFTGWLWLAGMALLVTVLSMVHPSAGTLLVVASCWSAVVWAWRVMRWWAERRYRVRVLPARRVRRVEP